MRSCNRRWPCPSCRACCLRSSAGGIACWITRGEFCHSIARDVVPVVDHIITAVCSCTRVSCLPACNFVDCLCSWFIHARRGQSRQRVRVCSCCRVRLSVVSEDYSRCAANGCSCLRSRRYLKRTASWCISTEQFELTVAFSFSGTTSSLACGTACSA